MSASGASSVLLSPPAPAPALLPRRLSADLRSTSGPAGNRRRRLAIRDGKRSGVGGVRSAPPQPVRCASLPPVAEVAPAASAAYGTLLLGGGLFAYARSGSKGSILGGLSGAALMAAVYYLMQNPETKAAGDALGFGSATLFSAIFGIRLAATRKLVPSGLLLGLSAGALALFVSAYMQDKI